MRRQSLKIKFEVFKFGVVLFVLTIGRRSEKLCPLVFVRGQLCEILVNLSCLTCLYAIIALG